MMRFKHCLPIWALLMISVVHGMTASPEPYQYQQPDGSFTPDVYLRGDYRYNWEEDEDGYTVIQADDGWWVYAEKARDGSHLLSSGIRVGYASPVKAGLSKGVAVDPQYRTGFDDEYPNKPRSPSYSEEGERAEEENQERRRLDRYAPVCNAGGKIPNYCHLTALVLMVRFQDHASRRLPPREDYDILYNNNGPTNSNGPAPSGSVADSFKEMSYDSFALRSDVTPWITVDRTEEYAVHDKQGMSRPQTRETWKRALQLLKQRHGYNYANYDENGDGTFDMLIIMHSGVGAESGGTDCEFKKNSQQRIWSHKHSANFYEGDGVKTAAFYVAAAVWHKNSKGQFCYEASTNRWNIAHIGVLTHEAGHFIGLPDLYDTNGGSIGLGNYDCMANSWGWSGDQYYPMHMNAWTKDFLGWVNVQKITSSGTYTIRKSCTNDQVYRIDHGYDKGEYLLIENRYVCKFDREFDRGSNNKNEWAAGLAIWHVDESGLQAKRWDPESNTLNDRVEHNTEGVCKNGECPNHYKVALIQGDGRYDLEKGVNYGDQNDLFRKRAGTPNAAYKISDNGVVLNNGSTRPEPNTKSYATGRQYPSGVTIEVKSDSGNAMVFQVTLRTTKARSIAAAKPQISYTLQMKFDAYPEDTEWFISDLSDYVANKRGGPYKNSQWKNKLKEVVISLNAGEKHHFCITDKYGDGYGDSGWWALHQGTGNNKKEVKRVNSFKTAFSCVAFTTPTNGPGFQNLPVTVPITLFIAFDNWPEDTSWDIKDSSNKIVKEAKQGKYNSNHKKKDVSQTVYLADGDDFTFTIYDKYGDGLRDGRAGYYALYYGTSKNNGELIYKNDKFGTATVKPQKKSTKFKARKKSTSAQRGIGGTRQVAIFVRFDNWAEDAKISIRQLPDGPVVFDKPAKSYGAEFNKKDVTETVDLEIGKEYEFTYEDTYGDGLSDGRADGYFGLYYGNSNTGQMIYENRDFKSGKKIDQYTFMVE